MRNRNIQAPCYTVMMDCIEAWGKCKTLAELTQTAQNKRQDMERLKGLDRNNFTAARNLYLRRRWLLSGGDNANKQPSTGDLFAGR